MRPPAQVPCRVGCEPAAACMATVSMARIMSMSVTHATQWLATIAFAMAGDIRGVSCSWHARLHAADNWQETQLLSLPYDTP